mmetsp:Transcript_16424/g.46743  ORF Transcript_16424/g.46743 Transcript_16424/m.46743 type:complete len:87 (-) Transcript_16424:14-274(-)
MWRFGLVCAPHSLTTAGWPDRLQCPSPLHSLTDVADDVTSYTHSTFSSLPLIYKQTNTHTHTHAEVCHAHGATNCIPYTHNPPRTN